MIWSNGIKALDKWINDQKWNVNYYGNKSKFVRNVNKGVKVDQKKNLGVLFDRIIKGNPVHPDLSVVCFSLIVSYFFYVNVNTIV